MLHGELLRAPPLVSSKGAISFKNPEVLFHTSARLLGVLVGSGGGFLTNALNTGIDF
jgi:hypothetical protein